MTAEAILLAVGVVLLLAGLAGDAVKAFNVEVPAIREKYPRLAVLALGAGFVGVALFLMLGSSDPTGNAARRDEPTPTVAATSTPTATPTTAERPTATPTTADTGDLPEGAAGFISAGQTVTGELVFDEGDSWIFRDGPGTIDILLELGPFGEALIIIFDPGGIDRAYADVTSGPQERLIFTVPSAGNYTIFVRNSRNEPTDYRLTVERAGG